MVLCAISALPAHAFEVARAHTRDSLLTVLPTITTAADSITVLYNIFDLSKTVPDRTAAAAQLLALAERSGDDEVAMDMIRQLANVNQSNDSLMVRLMKQMERFPDSDLKRETMVFLRVTRASLLSKYMSEDSRQEKILDLIKKYNRTETDDPYEHMAQLFGICSYLGNETHGQLLTEYFTDLERYASKLPLQTFLIRNKLFSQQAINYTNNGEPEKAIEADRKLLALIDELEDKHRRQGRKYRNLDLNRYISLRRILKNYRGLSLKEVQDYYDQILDVASRLETARADMEYYRQPQMCLYMKRGEYDKALPIIRMSLDKSADIFSRRYYLQLLMEAADELGDTDTRIKASMEYAKALEDFLKMKSAERYRELQIIYEVNRLRDRNTITELERQRESNRMQSIIINVSIVALVLLVIVVMVFIALFRRFKRLSSNLRRSNDELEHESDVLKTTRDKLIAARDKAREAERNKTEFINYISHEIITPLNTITEYSQMIIDSTDESRRDYLAHFSRVVQLNTLMLQSFVLDLQDFSQLESTRMTVKIRPSDLKAICMLSVDNIKGNLNPGVEIKFPKANDERVLIDTDPFRVQVVLLNLLSNAAKFTTKGTITLDYELLPEHVRFTVTDTGSGISPAMREAIAKTLAGTGEKFVKDTVGLGLPVCRLIATLLRGTVELDPTYTRGARFIFTIPR